MIPPRRRVLLFSPANLNVIDGSSVWLLSVAETLHQGPSVETTIPLRVPERRDVLTRTLRRLSRVELFSPVERRHSVSDSGLHAAEVLDWIEALDERAAFDAIILRSFVYAYRASHRKKLRDRVWATYILEPERDIEDHRYLRDMAAIADTTSLVVVQSEEMRSLLEGLVPSARGRTILLPPAVPPESIVPAPLPELPRRLVYAGKMNPIYPVPYMIEILGQLRHQWPDLELEVTGDKLLRAEPEYSARLERLLRTRPGVIWHGGVARDEVGHRLAQGGVALSFWDVRRGPRMNDLVVSTKLLDYCAAGLPVVLNRTPAQENILGRDYPLFISRLDEAIGRIRAVLSDPDLYLAAAEQCRVAALRFSYPNVYASLEPYLNATPESSLLLFDRPKLPGAEYNVAVLPGFDPNAVYRIAEDLASYDPRWRLVLPTMDRQTVLRGADPARESLADAPTPLRRRLEARTVDDPWNWWRTVGFVVAPAGPPNDGLRQAVASGAIPVMVGSEPDQPSPVDGWAAVAVPAAAALIASIVRDGGWQTESSKAQRSVLPSLAAVA